jgi:anti-sigma regulatory factor (Ser/Thr protein kinase)
VTRFYPVDEPSRVAEIRRAAVDVASEEGLSETLAGNAALVATEICTNLLKHAGGGEVFLSKLSPRSEPGMEILAVDRGPGMKDVSQCLEDGYSSTHTSGNGLGAIARLSQEFDIYSEQAKGTVLVARVRQRGFGKTFVGAALKPMTGEEVSGDAWAFARFENTTALIVADGLGHGYWAAQASAKAVAAFLDSGDLAPIPVLQRIHASLRRTRGAAVSVAVLDRSSLSLRYSGLGNITGVLVGGEKPLMMVSHSGTAGYGSPRLQEFSYPLAKDGLVVMHSDGLHTNWNLDRYPGLTRRDPSVVAGVLYRDYSRNRDDVCVVVARSGGAP